MDASQPDALDANATTARSIRMTAAAPSLELLNQLQEEVRSQSSLKDFHQEWDVAEDLFTQLRAALQADPVAVAWVRYGVIRDDDGTPIGDDEPEVRFQADNPDPDSLDGAWYPLYTTPPPAALQADRAAVGDGMVIGATHCVGEKWFKEITIGRHTLLAPLDDFTGAAAMLANAIWPRKDTAPPAAVPAGFVLVPVKPTTPMMDAPSKYRPGFSPHVAADIYRDMLAAAPKQPTDEAPAFGAVMDEGSNAETPATQGFEAPEKTTDEAPAKGDCPVCDGEFSDSCSRCSLQSQDSPT